MSKSNYKKNVFINCPFDNEYLEFRNATVFTIFYCGFIPRCALEVDNGSDVRMIKIAELIRESKLGVHDISRTELDESSQLPRFNMPVELGVFFGAIFFGSKIHKEKSCLILDREQYRFQKYISDIAGQDIHSHDNKINRLIKCLRDWLSCHTEDKKMRPGGERIASKLIEFQTILPEMCAHEGINQNEITFNDYSQFISRWLESNG